MIISLSAKAQSGKDTVGDYLVSNYSFTKIAFADALKKASMEVFGFTYEQVYDGKLKEVVDPRWGFTPRYALQKMGTDCMRNNFDREIWVKSLRAKILSNPHKNYCIVDTRFIEEVNAIKLWEGKLVKIIRNNLPQITGSQHESEIALENYTEWDHIVYNNGTFEELYKTIDNLINVLSK